MLAQENKMIEPLGSYINFNKIHDDLMEAYKNCGNEILTDDIPDRVIGFFEDSDAELDLEECCISFNKIHKYYETSVYLYKGKDHINANESDTQGSFYYYWIQYSFEEELIINGGYEQG